jgi:hypothetical protein
MPDDTPPRPDTIEPQSPQESPVAIPPAEEPLQQPDEITPTSPDTVQPDSSPNEVPPIPGN